MVKNKIVLNSMTSLVQMFLSAFITFFQYRYLFKTLGVSNLGIWSLILSVNFFLGASGFGIQGSIVKYVSKYYTKNDLSKTVDVVQTAFLSMAFFSLIGTLISYPVTLYILKSILDPASYSIAHQILPAAFLSFLVSMVGSITSSSLDGLNRIYIRNIISFSVTVLVFIMVIFVTPVWGLPGLTYLKVLESLMVLLASFVMTKKYLPSLPFFPKRWSYKMFREIISYSLKFQVINFSVILSEPLVKILLSKFGGVAYVGIYELANKMVSQIRSLIVATYQSLVPAMASYKETEPDKIKGFYISSYKLLFLICVVVFLFLIISSPVISRLWIGEINNRFIFLMFILSGSWFVNSLTISAYFTNMGTGDIDDNVVAHLIVGFVNLFAGFLFGLKFGGKGVAIATSMAIISGGLYQLFFFHKRNKLIDQIIPKEVMTLSFIALVLAGMYIFIVKQHIYGPQFILYTTLFSGVSMVFMTALGIRNKIFAGIVGTINSKLSNLKTIK